ncbi:unnamed protein product [Rhodiola kirilowii]
MAFVKLKTPDDLRSQAPDDLRSQISQARRVCWKIKAMLRRRESSAGAASARFPTRLSIRLKIREMKTGFRLKSRFRLREDGFSKPKRTKRNEKNGGERSEI